MTTYLVTGATGQQGGATVKALLNQGAHVNALVRDPVSAGALKMQADGVSLFKGDFADSAAIASAVTGCKGVFLNLPPFGEVSKMCKAILSACKNAGVEIVVASTAMLTGSRNLWDDAENEKEGLKQYYEANLAIEQAVQHAGFKYWTILRPAWLYSNYSLPSSKYVFPGMTDQKILLHSFEESAKMPHVAGRDVGIYAAAALLNPVAFDQCTLELANESLTVEQVRQHLSTATGVDITARKRTPDEIEAAKGSTQMFQLWANRVDISLDTSEMQQKYSLPLTSFQIYLGEHRKDILM